MQTFTPKEYLMIDIASNYGLDKETWDARLDWFKSMLEPHLISIVDLTKNKIFQAFVTEADSPALFQAGCMAYRKALKGESITYPISLDATASGAQLLSVMMGCEKSGKLCNVVDTGRREDLYTNVNDLMNERLGEAMAVDRKAAKQAVMTALYGSTREPKKAFGEGERLSAFYDVMVTELPGVWEVNEGLLSLADPDAIVYNWVLPDNFHVQTKVMTTENQEVIFLGDHYTVPKIVQGPVERDLSLGANTTHSVDGMVVREMSRRCTFNQAHVSNLIYLLKSGYYEPKSALDRQMDAEMQVLWDHYLQSGFLSARILDLLDNENLWWVDKTVILDLLQSLPAKPFPVLAVHDCFRVHPNYGNDLRRQYNRILSDIAKSNILQFLVDQISNEHQEVRKHGDLSNIVLTANYALS